MKEVVILEKTDRRFPNFLKEISDPPERLWIRGEVDFNKPCLAIVGTRKPTSYGREAAKFFASALSHAGFTIVSGLALGIDTIAHEATLEAGGETIAVLGSGIDLIIPPSNQGLAEKISHQGAVITEFPPETPGYAGNFPQRNRIISGLSLGALIIEAGEKSGALITAGFAAAQGREVFAVPGPIFSLQSQGANKLIQDGAKPVISPEDILEEFQQLKLFREKKDILPLQEPSLQNIYSLIKMEALGVDEIAQKTNLAISELQTSLAKLELQNLIKRTSDGRYRIL